MELSAGVRSAVGKGEVECLAHRNQGATASLGHTRKLRHFCIEKALAIKWSGLVLG